MAFSLSQKPRISIFLIIFFFASLAQAKGLWDEAREKRAAKDYSAALDLYHEALQVEPGNIELLMEYAQTNAWAGRHQQAIEVYNQILEKEPKHGDALLGKAFVLSWNKKYKEAEELFRRVIDSTPDYIDAYAGLARMLSWQNKFDEAEELAEKALQLDSENKQTIELAAQIYFWGGRSKKAVSLYQQLLENDPKNTNLLVNYSRALWEAGRQKDAIQQLKEARSLEPENSRLGAELGNFYAQAHQLDDAINELEKAIALKSANVDDYISLGRVYSFKNRLDDAKKLYEKALAEDPNNTDALNGLARVYGYGREWALSKTTFEKVLELDATNIEALEGLDRLRKFMAPEFAVWHQYLRFRDKNPNGTSDIESLSRGPIAQYRYKFNPENNIVVRAARLHETDKNLLLGGKDINAVRSELGVGGQASLTNETNILGRFDYVRYSDEKGAFYSRLDDVSQGAGFLVLNHELKKHLFSAAASKEVFLLPNLGTTRYDMVYIRDYSFSDDIYWTNEFSTLFQAEASEYSYLTRDRTNLLNRWRYRPQAISNLLLESQAKYRNKPNEWTLDGFVTYNGSLITRVLTYRLTTSIHHNTLTSTTGPKIRTLINWRIIRDLLYTADFAYAKDVNFKGTQLELRNYFNLLF